MWFESRCKNKSISQTDKIECVNGNIDKNNEWVGICGRDGADDVSKGWTMSLRGATTLLFDFGGSEGVLDMVNMALSPVDENRNNVETDLFVSVVLDHIAVGKGDVGTLFFEVHEGLGGAVIDRGACFYFDEDDCGVEIGYDIDFVTTLSPIGVEDGVAFFQEIVLGELFAGRADVVVMSHRWGMRNFCRVRSEDAHDGAAV